MDIEDSRYVYKKYIYTDIHVTFLDVVLFPSQTFFNNMKALGTGRDHGEAI